MSKRYEEDVEVVVDPYGDGAPLGFLWRGRRYAIDAHLESWLEAGEWWLAKQNGDARDRVYYRVLARPAGWTATGDLDPDGFMVTTGAVYDLYRDRIAKTWRLARIWD